MLNFKAKTSSMVIQLGHQILDGKSPRLFENSIQISRDFIYVEDVIQANIKACTSQQSGTFNVGTGISRNFQEIADILQKELGTNLGTDYFPNPYDGYQMHTQAEINKLNRIIEKYETDKNYFDDAEDKIKRITEKMFEKRYKKNDNKGDKK